MIGPEPTARIAPCHHHSRVPQRRLNHRQVGPRIRGPLRHRVPEIVEPEPRTPGPACRPPPHGTEPPVGDWAGHRRHDPRPEAGVDRQHPRTPPRLGPGDRHGAAPRPLVLGAQRTELAHPEPENCERPVRGPSCWTSLRTRSPSTGTTTPTQPCWSGSAPSGSGYERPNQSSALGALPARSRVETARPADRLSAGARPAPRRRAHITGLCVAGCAGQDAPLPSSAT
jgi:hypothetical protein